MSTAAFDVPAAGRARGPAPYRDEDFPGCESFHLPAKATPKAAARAMPKAASKAMPKAASKAMR